MNQDHNIHRAQKEVDGYLSIDVGHQIAHKVKDALLNSDLKVIDTLIHIEPYHGR